MELFRKYNVAQKRKFISKGDTRGGEQLVLLFIDSGSVDFFLISFYMYKKCNPIHIWMFLSNSKLYKITNQASKPKQYTISQLPTYAITAHFNAWVASFLVGGGLFWRAKQCNLLNSPLIGTWYQGF